MTIRTTDVPRTTAAKQKFIDSVFANVMQYKPCDWESVPAFPLSALSEEVKDVLGRLRHGDLNEKPWDNVNAFAIGAADGEEYFIGMRKGRDNKEQRFLVGTEGSAWARYALRLS